MFKLSTTFGDPTAGDNAQRGFPAPGEGAQTTGDGSEAPAPVVWETRRWLSGVRSWLMPGAPVGEQRGFAEPENAGQRRPAGSMPNVPAYSGLPENVWTPYYSRGTAAIVNNYGKVLTNPIGAGIVALNRPQASYGQAAEYVNGAIWWTSQAIPTTVNLQGLVSPDALASIIDSLNIEAVVRTTG